LMMHGGLSGQVLEHLRSDLTDSCHSSGAACGKAVVGRLNQDAKVYFARLRECMQQALLSGSDPAKCAGDGVAAVSKPNIVADPLDGVLWYRGYSQSPTNERCDEARVVAKQIGADTMAVAHTTHDTIKRYCNGTGQVSVWVTDTHTEDCEFTGECDNWEYKEAKKYHKGESIDQFKRQVPQSLSITIDERGMKMFETCFWEVTDGAVTNSCFAA